MITSILFDLDNTLVLFDEGRFYGQYIPQLSKRFRDILSEKQFFMRLIEATREMMNNDGNLKNMDFFLDAFCSDLRISKTEVWNRFIAFYDDEYDTLDPMAVVTPGLKDLFGYLENKNLKLVIASNPIFPLGIQLKRMAWAGLDFSLFVLITNIENMSFCKPREEYYLQICRMIGESPGHCLMVGNDPVNDMVAANVGLKTFLSTDSSAMATSVITMPDGFKEPVLSESPEPDFSGPLASLKNVISGLMAA